MGLSEQMKDVDDYPVNGTPIAGVDLETYAWVLKQIAPFEYDQSMLPDFAARRGISPADWQTAMDGWAIRLDDPAVAGSFRRLYDAS